MTPNKYEETTDNDNAYTYSMYTETIMGRSDNQSKAPRSRKDCPKDYLSSIGTTIMHNNGQLTSQGVTNESPEREMIHPEGTAIFATNQLRQYASQSSAER